MIFAVYLMYLCLLCIFEMARFNDARTALDDMSLKHLPRAFSVVASCGFIADGYLRNGPWPRVWRVEICN